MITENRARKPRSIQMYKCQVTSPSMTDTIKLPPGPRTPRAIQGLGFIVDRHKSMERRRRKYGSSYTVNIPIFGRAVVISDPVLVKQLFMTSTDIAKNVEPNLGRVLGKG